MNIAEFTEKFIDYVDYNKGAWLGLHDAHRTELSQDILNEGLTVSYNPYGGKIRHIKDKNGNIDLNIDFMPTMFAIKPEDRMPPMPTVPVCPIIVNIPKELVDIAHITPGINNEHILFCGYGYEPPSEDGLYRAKMKYQDTPEGANIRMLPAYLVAGYFDTQTGEFINNPKHYSNLTKEEQEKIKLIVSNQYEKYQDWLNSQSQPQ